MFLARHIELHSVSESLDTSTPHGRFVLTLFGGLAQMERELIAERTRSALAFKRENGNPTSHPPLGFRATGRRDRMLPVPEELAVVVRILDLWRDRPELPRDRGQARPRGPADEARRPLARVHGQEGRRPAGLVREGSQSRVAPR